MNRAPLGSPRVHLRTIDSTNDHAFRLATAGAPHGTLVTCDEQRDGHGRQGRSWAAPAGLALCMSVIWREPPALLPLIAGVAVAEVVFRVSGAALLKWPNDVQLSDGRKVAGILVEGRPQEHWSVLGIGLNAACDVDRLPTELHDSAGGLGLDREDLEPLLGELIATLERVAALPPRQLLDHWRQRDVLCGRTINWRDAAGAQSGIAAGIDDDGNLLVDVEGARATLRSGEVHLARLESRA